MPLGRLSHRLLLLLAFVLLVPASLVLPVPKAEALTVDAMTQNGYYDVHGDFILVGNGVLTSTTNSYYGYSPAYLFQGGTDRQDANDFYRMVNADVDGSSATFNSTSATYTIPKGATVVAAKVIWSGNTGGGVGYTGTSCTGYSDRPATLPPLPATSSPSTQQVRVTVNGATAAYPPSGYTTDVGRSSVSGNPYYYSANADVTAQFAGLVGDGAAKTLTVGNVWTPQGYGCYGGWALQLVYDFGSFDANQATASQRRGIYLFDGYERKFSGDATSTMTLNGLQPQGAGAKMGVVAFEGDASIDGDFVRYSDSTSPLTAVPNAATNASNNYFVGRADGAVNYTPYGGTFYNASVNAQTSSLPNVVAGDSTLTLSVGTSGDSFLMTDAIVSVPMADIKITKTAINGEQDAAYAPGSSPSFRITVTNSGSVAIQKISVTDAMVAGCARTEAQMTALINSTFNTTTGFMPSGGSIEYACTAPATSAGYTNNAKVTGQTGTGIPVGSSNDSKVLIGKWEVTKTAKYPDVPSGAMPTWVFTVNNTGTADIFNIQVNDPDAPACAKTIPLVQADTKYTYECVGPAPITTTTTNGFTATGTAKATSTATITVPLTAGIPATDPNAPKVEASSIKLVKTVDKATASVGEKVTFSFVITNTGSAMLDTIALTDPDFTSCNQANVGPLAPGASKTVTCTVAAFGAASSTALTNHATVVATSPSGQTVSSTSEVDVNNKSLKVTKKATTTDANANSVLDTGDQVNYTFTVTNTGSGPLSAITVSDPLLAGATITCTPTTLAAGTTATCAASKPYTVTQANVDAGTLKNTATATGTAPDNSTTTGTASLTLTPVAQPAVTMAKTANPTTVTAVGTVVNYTFTITNSGNTTLSGVTPADPLAGLSALTCRNAAGASVTVPATLAPGSVLTCTASRATTQADLNAGSVVNTATVTATGPNGTKVDSSASATVIAAQRKTMSVTKTADKTTFSTVGEVVSYTFTTTNTGNVVLNGVQMTDPLTRLANRTCTPAQPAVLQPGEKVTCTATLTVSQADIDGGAIVNTVSATANPPSGAALTGSATWTVAPAPTAGLTLAKVPSRDTITAAGQAITYTFTASNTGNTTMSNVRIADPLPGLVMGACTPVAGSSLAPGAKMVCTASYTSTQADVDAGRINNTATATGTDSHGQAASVPASATVTAPATPAIKLTKSANPSTVTAVGQQVTYTFAVQNSGNVTLRSLALSDKLAGLSAITCTPMALGGSLAPGASTTCTATRATTQADLTAGAVNNTATATGTPPTGAAVTSTATAKVTATQNPSFTVDKTANPLEVTAAGQRITYSIVVANDGNVPLTNLRVSDPRITTLTCTPTALGATLQPGARTTCTGTYVATQADVNAGAINNTATATLAAPGGADTSKTASAVVTSSRTPGLTIDKTGSASTYAAVGDTIAYTITTTNSGNVTMNQIQVTDSMFPAAQLACSPTVPATLQPGQRVTCTATRTITQADVDRGTLPNTATARGTSATGATTEVSDDFVATATQKPAITLAKTPSPTTINAAGRAIGYTIVLTNSGNVSVTNAQISDPRFASFTTCTPALGSKLAPGATMTCTGTYTSTQADVDSGAILNTVRGTAVSPTNTALSSTATAVVAVTRSPALSLQKSAAPTRVGTVGQVVTYSFQVTNTGNVTATALTVNDPLPGLSAVSCPVTTLAPGATTTCTATRATTQVDLNLASGRIDNTATAQAKDPVGATVTSPAASATVTINQTPKLAVTKTASPTTVKAVGDPVSYTIVVTNSGNVDATNVRVTDSLIDAAQVSCTPAQGTTLAPGATMRCTATRATTQSDLDNGKAVNLATATGTAPNGQAITPAQATATVTATRLPALTLDKTSTTALASAVGQTVQYSYLVTNTGNVTLASLAVTDPHPGLSGIDCGGTSSLAPGGTATCVATYTVTQADLNAGALTNTGTVSMEAPGGDNANPADNITAKDSLVVPAEQKPDLAFAKKANVTTYSATGRVITYSFVVTNTGNVDVANVRVADPHAGLSALSCTPAQGTTLAPRATMNCTATYTTTQADLDRLGITNTATATATAPDGSALNRTGTVTLDATLDSKMDLNKTPSPASITAAGQKVTYTFVATNTGNSTLRTVTVNDTDLPGLSAITCDTNTLVPGAKATCTASYTATQTDVDRGSIPNTASVSGTDPAGTVVDATAKATVSVPQNPALGLDKTAGRAVVDQVGQRIDYTFTISNSGNVTVNSLTVADPMKGLSAPACAQTSLAPGASTTCTASYTTTQADMDRGELVNTAEATARDPRGNPVEPSADTVRLPVVGAPKLAVTKQARSSEVIRAGETVDFSVVVTNTGTVSAHEVEMTDNSAVTTGCDLKAPVVLAPGASMTCTVQHVVTQDEINAGQVVNVATATAMTPAGVPVDPARGSAVVPAQRQPELLLDKAVSPATFQTLGEQLTYTFTTTNTGNTTLEGLRVDDQIDGLSALTCTPALGSSLDPGQKQTCTATRAITQADLDRGLVANTATATAENIGGNPDDPADDITSTATAETTGLGKPSLSLAKTANVTEVTTQNDVITYTFVAKNTGNVTIHDVVVSDPKTGQGMTPIQCPTSVLAPQQSMTCTATFTAAQIDLDRGTIPNTATVAGLDPWGSAVTPAEGSTTVDVVQQPAFGLSKTADHTLVTTAGERVLYTFIGTNNGNVTLHGVTVTDPLPGLEPMDCYPRMPAELPPGERIVCRAWYSVTQADLDAGQLVNTATLKGNDPAGAPVDPVTDDETITTVPADVKMALTKTVDATELTAAGQQLTYTFELANTGNQTLADVVLSDELAGLGPITCTDALGASRPMPDPQAPLGLAPGEKRTCTAAYTVTQADIDRGELYNVATLNANQGGTALEPVRADRRLLGTRTPGLDVEKSASAGKVTAAGDPVTWTFTLTNTGTVTATDLRLTDQMAGLADPACTVDGQTVQATLVDGVLSLPGTSLAPAGRAVCTVQYAVTQADIDRGSLSNTVTASGQTPGGPAGDTDTVTVPVEPTSAVSFTKTADKPVVKPGEVVTYTFTMTNDGTTTATISSLGDTMAGLSTPTCDTPLPAVLAPGASNVCHATRPVWRQDAEVGTLTNGAYIKASDPLGVEIPTDPATVVVPVTPSPAATLAKSAALVDANGDGVGSVSETVNYTLTMTNTGDVSLRGATISDPMLPRLTCAPALTEPLAPDAVRTCTGSHVISEQEAEQRQVRNVATLQSPQLPDPVVAEATQETSPNAHATFVKSAALADTNGDGIGSVGESVNYAIITTNDGDVTLTGLAVTDPMLPGLSCTPAQDQPLPVGATRTCRASHVISQAEVEAGPVVNTATLTGSQVGTLTSTAIVPTGGNPDVAISKAARLDDANGDGVGTVGETIGYTITVRNTGDVQLTDLVVNDPMLPQLTCSPSPAGPLQPGAVITCTGSHVITTQDAEAGRVTNVATVSGPQLPTTESDSTTTMVEPNPSASLTKSAALDDANGDGAASVGELVTWTLTVTNTGDVELRNLQLADPMITSLDCTPAAAEALPVGGVRTCTAGYRVTQADALAGAVTNTATLTGPQLDRPVTATATVPAAANPSASVTKDHQLADTNADGVGSAGEKVTYLIRITNTGDVDLAGMEVDDPMLPQLACTPGLDQPVAVGARVVCTGEHVITEAEALAGAVDNTVVARVPGVPTDPTDTEIVRTQPRPGVDFTKTARLSDGNGDEVGSVGELVDYTLTMRNTGDVALTGLAVSDPMLTDLTCVPSMAEPLAVGASRECTGSHVVTEADALAGSVVNTATLTSPQVPGIPPATAVVTTRPSVSITLTKSPDLADTNGDGAGSLGETITYTLGVTNNGDVTVPGLTVSDPMLADLACTPGQDQPLEPGATRTCTGTHVVTRADVEAGQVVNRAQASSELTGTVWSPTVVVPTKGQPAATLVKTASDASGDGVGAVGETITYTITLTNTGDLPLTDAVVTDPMLGDSLVCTPAQDQPVLPGATRVCTGTHVVSPAEAAGGSLVNTATLHSPSIPDVPPATAIVTTRVDEPGPTPPPPAPGPSRPAPATPAPPTPAPQPIASTGSAVPPWLPIAGLLMTLSGIMLIARKNKENS